MGLVVETKYGKVEGFSEEGINKWLGIPYAKPPIGKLRFKRTEKCVPWAGVKETKNHGNKPHQFLDTKLTDIPASEDCLFLNIWAPREAKDLPVFVWIYGGAYSIGECSDPNYDGTNFAKDGVIYVAFNYRLGVLGIYDFSIYDDSFDSNCGVADQIEALIWIKENIATFGGDSNNITIAGESAGAASVINMLAAPKSKGLFNKAIAESPIPGCVHNHYSTKLNMNLFLKVTKIAPGEVYKLKTLHPDEMKHAAEYLLFNNCNLYPGIFLPGPVIDDLIPEHPIDAISKGCAKDIKLIIGTNDDDGALFVKVEATMFPSSWEQVRKMLELNHCIDKLEDLHQLYDGLSENKQMKELAKDRAFLIDSIKVADRQSGYNSTWMYRFDYAPILTRLVGLKSVHGVEVPIALDNLGRGVIRRFWKGAPKKVMYKLRDDMHTAWVNFAKNSDPNRDLDMYWPNYNAEIRATFIFNENNRVVMNPSEKNYDVWNDIKLYID
ncbi:carboxylesterase/lipase family protein [Clostridium folliculivorans]|uniref:carboxylesterase/lipase family protein n=1 Tax=Clostridium folliculivorans TaxID=2886038 RepID=UPI0021C31C87|nr:carboxylesterase/lipase family protein [Clostridium folliculivorans]GKU31067.1 carboxylic ester hydrolase [Clostridium folliculivorans]